MNQTREQSGSLTDEMRHKLPFNKSRGEQVRMWRLKGCPRCQGDMLVERDYHGCYEWCLQCGYQHDLIGIIKLPPQDKVESGVAENV